MLHFELQSIVFQNCDSKNTFSATYLPNSTKYATLLPWPEGRQKSTATNSRDEPSTPLLSIDPMTLSDGRGLHLHLLVNPIELVMGWTNVATKALTKRSHSSLQCQIC